MIAARGRSISHRSVEYRLRDHDAPGKSVCHYLGWRRGRERLLPPVYGGEQGGSATGEYAADWCRSSLTTRAGSATPARTATPRLVRSCSQPGTVLPQNRRQHVPRSNLLLCQYLTLNDVYPPHREEKVARPPLAPRSAAEAPRRQTPGRLSNPELGRRRMDNGKRVW